MMLFFDECCRMKTFKHPNVVELIGMCLDSPNGYPLMILPLFPNENLKTYLQKSRGFSPNVDRLPPVSGIYFDFYLAYMYKASLAWKIQTRCKKYKIIDT